MIQAEKITWPKLFTDLFLSGEWASLSPLAKAVLPCHYINSKRETRRHHWDTAMIAKATGLSTKSVKRANRELAASGLIRREWDGNPANAAVTTWLAKPMKRRKWARPTREQMGADQTNGVGSHQTLGGGRVTPDPRGRNEGGVGSGEGGGVGSKVPHQPLYLTIIDNHGAPKPHGDAGAHSTRKNDGIDERHQFLKSIGINLTKHILPRIPDYTVSELEQLWRGFIETRSESKRKGAMAAAIMAGEKPAMPAVAASASAPLPQPPPPDPAKVAEGARFLANQKRLKKAKAK